MKTHIEGMHHQHGKRHGRDMHGKIAIFAACTLLIAGLIYHLGFGGSPIPALSGIAAVSLHLLATVIVGAHGTRMLRKNNGKVEARLNGLMNTMHGGTAHGAAPETDGELIQWGKFYDAVVKIFFAGKEQSVRLLTVQMADLKPGDRVLDVGCGTGTLTLFADKAVGPRGAAHGIDASPEMIEVAKKKVADGAGAASFQVALAEEIPFPDSSFDAVISSLMFHHLPGDDLKRRSLAEIRRVLKPGGRLLIVDFEPPTGFFSKRLFGFILGDMMQSNVRAFARMLKDSGFRDVTDGRTKFKLVSFTTGVN